MMVEATRPGFYGGQRRRKGDVFRVSDTDRVGTWMVVVPDPEAAVQEPKPGQVNRRAARVRPGSPVEHDDDEPVSLSELAKRNENDRVKKAEGRG